MDDVPPDRERDDLAELIASPGWTHFCQYVASEWSDTRVVERMRALVNDPMATELPAEVLRSQERIHHVMSWPRTRVHHLTKPIAPRRGL